MFEEKKLVVIEMLIMYDLKVVEQKWYFVWIECGYFKVGQCKDVELFIIVILFLNVIGMFYIGYVLDFIFQDILICIKWM